MPLYEYKAQANGCSVCETGFEVQQKLEEAPLETCPDCHQPIQKVFSASIISRREGQLLSRKNLEKNGFLRYEKSKDGTYVKTAGTQGPAVLRKPRY